MAKKNLGRVQGASIFYYDGDASSLEVNRYSLVPDTLTPMVGDTVIDKKYSLYTITTVLNITLLLELNVELTFDYSEWLFATPEEIQNLFD